MGDPRSGAIYQLQHGEVPQEGHVPLTEMEAAMLKAIPDVEERKRILAAMQTQQVARPLTFKEYSKVSLSRCLRWHPAGIEEWSVSDWAMAMAGEAGEVCNAVKKLRRLETGAQQTSGPQTREAAIAEIAKEIGDTYAYLDLLAQRLGIDIEKAIKDTFNRISERENFPERL